MIADTLPPPPAPITLRDFSSFYDVDRFVADDDDEDLEPLTFDLLWLDCPDEDEE